MMKKQLLADQIRQLNLALYSSEGMQPDLNQTLGAIVEVIGAAAVLLSKAGVVLARYTGAMKVNGQLNKLIESGSLETDKGYMKLIKANEPVYNELYPEGKEQSGQVLIIIPITAGDNNSAMLLLCQQNGNFSEEQKALAECGALLLSIIHQHLETNQKEAEKRDRKLAQGAFESLSYSEVEAIQEILKNITNNESIVIASKIADNLGITRSVIVNALRKFESAGIIESRSLGMKGTFIRVKNEHALELIVSRSNRSGSFG
jgi:transcriptional pleiotropic repressor